MTPLQMQAYFELEINKIDELEKPESSDIFYFINQAALKFTKSRYSGMNIKREGFEDSQKRMDDLRTLVKETRLVPTVPSLTGPGALPASKPNSSYITLPSSYFVTISEEVDITFTGLAGTTQTTREGITECNLDTYSFKVKDPFEMHNLHMDSAWPLRMYINGQVWLVTDGNYTIPYYYLTYLKYPDTITISVACELPEHTHQEIVKLAVDMYLENISDKRINTYPNQVNTME